MSDRYLKKVLDEVKKIEKAISSYTKLSRVPAIPYRAFLNYADYFFLTGCFEQAEDFLKNAINYTAVSSDAMINLGALKQTTGKFDEALAYYENVLKNDPKNVKALCFWGNCLSFQGDVDTAIEKYKRAIEIDNKYSEAYLCWGINLLKKQDFKDARNKFEIAAKYNEKDARALFLMASTEIEMGLYDEALDKLNFIALSTEKNYGAYHNIAYIHFKRKNYDKAIEYVKAAIEIMPLKLESYMLLGDSYALQKKYNEALETYKSAEEHGLKSLFLYISWGNVLQNSKNYPESIDKYIKAFEFENATKNIELYTNLALSYLKINNLNDAEFNIQKALELESENTYTMKVYADIWMYKKDYNKALELFGKCLKNIDVKPEAYFSIAKCYTLIGNINAAKQNYEYALEYDRNNLNIMLEYVNFLNQNNLFDDAQAKIRTLENMSNNEYEVLSLIFEINYNIAKSNFYGYNRKKAIQVAEKIKQIYPDKFVFEREYNYLKGISRESCQ